MTQHNARFISRPIPAILALTAFLLFALAVTPLPGFAAAEPAPTATATEQEPEAPASEQWQIKADKLSAQHDTEILEAEGNVHLWQGKQFLKADFARYYRSTGWVYLRGNVEAVLGKDEMEAEEAEFDLRNKTGWLNNGQIFTPTQNLYFNGEHIEKHQGDTYSFKNATVTACDGDEKAWSIDMVEGEVTLEGYAWLWHPKLKAGDFPVFYSPLAILPAKKKRQSGLLMPEWGTSSRLGTFYNQPYFWAIDDESDATFYFNYMSSRGYQQGLEYRHTPDTKTKGLWKLDIMRDNVVDDTEADEDGQFDNDGLTRSNSSRYWFRSKYDGYLFTPDWITKLDIDWVSDQNYLREFDNGMLGFAESDKIFLDEFDRDLDNADDETRESTLLINRSWDYGGVALKSQWTRNLNFENGNNNSSENDTVQVLPELSAYLWKTSLWETPLEGQLDVKASNFWREYGTTGSRLDIHPKLSLPVAYQGISIIPTIGVRETAWMTDKDAGSPSTETDNDATARLLLDANITAFTEFYKVFDLGGEDELIRHESFTGESRWTKLKHSIQPRIEYDWKPYVSQTEKPFFDEVDRISAQNELVYSLTNLFDRRRETVTTKEIEGQGSLTALSTDYLEFMRFRLEQGYDLREATRTDERDEYARRPFSDVMAELSYTPREWLTYTHRSFFSPYLGEWTETNDSIRVSWDDVGWFRVRYDFNRAIDEYKRQDQNQIRQIRFDTYLSLFDPWYIGVGYRSNLKTGATLEKLLTLIYRHQCYALHFLLDSTENDTRIEARIVLMGISF
ncbi:LPS-assembly protein LptD [Desulfovibrio ferrophilus]|uniref:Organic solvent tolerance protein n=1 Tax=Desulfovibrio ferrophilus TaxID=241368 RepID=A0A2Z6AXM2_9BACT|nr:LPS assembly protein LptD [Desulfovibrio ferrophilus]BBD07955.1 organic solvent tolerance protein [Desulfovibrio ferrophilus]